MSKEGFLNHLAEQKKNSNHYRGTDFVFINIGKDYRKKKVFILPLKDEDWLRENEEMIIKINCKHFDRMVFLNTR